MKRSMLPVDVISLCSSDGELRPLRLRMEDENRELIRFDILEAVKISDISHVGAEGSVFRCRVRSGSREMTVELKFTFRSHTWSLLRRIC